MKLFFFILLFIFLSGCYRETSIISNYGQSIVKIPNQTDAIDDLNAIKSVNKSVLSLSKKGINICTYPEMTDYLKEKY